MTLDRGERQEQSLNTPEAVFKCQVANQIARQNHAERLVELDDNQNVIKRAAQILLNNADLVVPDQDRAELEKIATESAD